LEILSMRGSDKNIIGVDGDVLVEWGKKESVKEFVGDAGGSGHVS
jgi:hypothetical protein